LSGKPAAAPSLRLGVYGGAFDPPHKGHHALAQAAIAQLQLDQLRIFPTGYAWHKSYQPIAASHRIAMAQLAFADLMQVQMDTRETQRPGATYTIDTLMELCSEQPQAELFLVMGADQFNAFTNWHRWQDVAKIATVCIAARAIAVVEKGLNDMENRALTECKIRTIPMSPMPISATDIRHRVGQGLPIDHLVNPSVARYIALHHLYSNPI
jgi:nicotinate-nucleotide adenylyltransferase